MYYSAFGMLSLVICVVINLEFFRDNASGEHSSATLCYRRFLYSVYGYLVTDIIWGFTYDAHLIAAVFLDTELYFLAMALSVMLWTVYVVEYLKYRNVFDRILVAAGKVMLAMVAVCLVVNLFYPILFYFDEDGVYQPMPVRYLFLGMQIMLFTLISLHTLFFFFRSEGSERHHNLVVAVSGMAMASFVVLQIQNPLLPYYAIGCLLASCLIHSFVSVEEEQEQNRILASALEEAERASTAKTAFLSNMSHEIRTPINAILGMNEIIRRDCRDEKIRACADNIQKAGTSLLGIISDILDLSKIEAGKMELNYADYYSPDSIYDVYNLVRFRAEDKGLAYRFEVDPELPRRFYGDEIRIKQVLANLLTNAVKYTEKGSVTLRIQVHEKNGNQSKLRFSVKDTGIGIKEEEKDKLFEAFDRLDMKRTRTIEGAGLGLSISSYILKLMGSKLCVDSIYNVGSEFYFIVDQQITDDTPIGDPWIDAISDGGSSDSEENLAFTSPESRILLVDDTYLNLQVIHGLLEPTRMQIDLAESGRECVEKFAEADYDFVFLDYLMPQMDGIETLAKIKELFPEKAEQTPIVSLTASAVSGERERMLAAGFTDYLSKPVIVSDVMRMLLKYLPEEKVHFADESAEGQEPQAQDACEGIPQGLQDIPWVDVKEGIEYCGTADMYIKALAMYANTIDDKAALLADCLEKQDIHLFTVTVHAIKSSSLTMGMADFSAKAKELELAGKKNDLAMINEKFSGFIKEYRDLKSILLEAVG